MTGLRHDTHHTHQIVVVIPADDAARVDALAFRLCLKRTTCARVLLYDVMAAHDEPDDDTLAALATRGPATTNAQVGRRGGQAVYLKVDGQHIQRIRELSKRTARTNGHVVRAVLHAAFAR